MALSLEGRHPQAARAWVHAVQAGSITLALDRPLRPGLLQQGQVSCAARVGIVTNSKLFGTARWRQAPRKFVLEGGIHCAHIGRHSWN